jgi:hypothetical protein
MFENGQFVLCINDWFPPCAVEWGNQFPQAGAIYRIKEVKLCPDARTAAPGYGLVLNELDNPYDSLAFSTWRFLPIHGEGDQPSIAPPAVALQVN